MYVGLHVKYPLFLSDFNKTCVFSIDFRKKVQILNFIKIRQAAANFFHADRQTEEQTGERTDRQTYMTKLTAAFRNFANAPENKDAQECKRNSKLLCSKETALSVM